MKSFVIEATVFWLIVNAILIAVGSDPWMLASGLAPWIVYGKVAGLAFAAIYAVLAYACWNLRRWSFVAAMVLALFMIVSGVALAFSGLFNGTTIGSEALAGPEAFLTIPQLILLFYSLRAYRELTRKP